MSNEGPLPTEVMKGMRLAEVRDRLIKGRDYHKAYSDVAVMTDAEVTASYMRRMIWGNA